MFLTAQKISTKKSNFKGVKVAAFGSAAQQQQGKLETIGDAFPKPIIVEEEK